VTQINMQQTMRTLAFIAETCVFAYLGLALFSFRHRVEPALVVWSIVLCLIGRACNIFPLAILCNHFREHQITHKMMFIMWFSGKWNTVGGAHYLDILETYGGMTSENRTHTEINFYSWVGTTWLFIISTTMAGQQIPGRSYTLRTKDYN
jgi:hypothetical protein